MNLLADPYWTKTDDDKFIRIYPMDTGWDILGLRFSNGIWTKS